MKVGFFGGTFDPIHLGHLNLAIEVQEKFELDEVLFCPNALSPHKQLGPPTALAFHRLQMVRLALEALPYPFFASDVEIQEGRSCYTIDTIKFLIERANKEKSETEFHLLLGEDALPGLNQWKDIEQLISLAPPIIGSRLGSVQSMQKFPDFLVKAIQKGMFITPLMDISSTNIRYRLLHRKYCGHLLPLKVLDYIEHYQLYSY